MLIFYIPILIVVSVYIYIGVFFGSAEEEDRVLYDSALRTRDMGRLLMATEIRAAKTYWHVQSPDTPGVDRIYPSVYESKVVGMMWSMLAQQQTWFGNEPWKSYGIQVGARFLLGICTYIICEISMLNYDMVRCLLDIYCCSIAYTEHIGTLKLLLQSFI
ncbi:hypothetical protein EON64_11080 [archaeon]|nr:MAG: hypothetical protein EON64_11080 [archaeon]